MVCNRALQIAVLRYWNEVAVRPPVDLVADHQREGVCRYGPRQRIKRYQAGELGALDMEATPALQAKPDTAKAPVDAAFSPYRAKAVGIPTASR